MLELLGGPVHRVRLHQLWRHRPVSEHRVRKSVCVCVVPACLPACLPERRDQIAPTAAATEAPTSARQDGIRPAKPVKAPATTTLNHAKVLGLSVIV